MLDAIILGGGLIGLASALELAGRGLRVCLLDRGAPGAQASFAAAGILGPQSEAPAPSPMLELGRRSWELYPAFVAPLGQVGFRACGTLHLAFTAEEAERLAAQRAWQVQEGVRVEERASAARLALFFPDEGQVDNRKLLAALRAACVRAGVELRSAAASAVDGGRVVVQEGELRARAVVVCCGSWTGKLLPLPVSPVRGQMIALDARPPSCVVFGGGGYLVPRDGRTLVGATMEQAGFDARPTDAGRAELLQVAARHGVQGRVVDHWAGLRPATPDGLPCLGRVPGGALVAAGHYRNGVLLTPISARIVAALVLGETPPLDLSPFDPARALRSA